ncbi:type I-E CRISPR-associated protein Cse2/CasB [Leptothrix sp. BB-4]
MPPEDAPARSHWSTLASHIRHAGKGERAALARLDPEALQPQAMGPLSRALLAAGLGPESWHPRMWSRWALIAHGMALAGHDGRGRLGEQLVQAGVAESRVSRLLTARGDAFRQMLPSLLRLMASKGVAPNWRELGPLVLHDAAAHANGNTDPLSSDAAELLRLRIAGPYFSTLARRTAIA